MPWSLRIRARFEGTPRSANDSRHRKKSLSVGVSHQAVPAGGGRGSMCLTEVRGASVRDGRRQPEVRLGGLVKTILVMRTRNPCFFGVVTSPTGSRSGSPGSRAATAMTPNAATPAADHQAVPVPACDLARVPRQEDLGLQQEVGDQRADAEQPRPRARPGRPARVHPAVRRRRRPRPAAGQHDHLDGREQRRWAGSPASAEPPARPARRTPSWRRRRARTGARRRHTAGRRHRGERGRSVVEEVRRSPGQDELRERVTKARPRPRQRRWASTSTTAAG